MNDEIELEAAIADYTLKRTVSGYLSAGASTIILADSYLADREARLKQEADDAIPLDREYCLSLSKYSPIELSRDQGVRLFIPGTLKCVTFEDHGYHTPAIEFNGTFVWSRRVITRIHLRKLLEALETP